MATRESILETVERDKSNPIYVIMVFENPDMEQISIIGKPLGWPDEGIISYMGFYHNIDDAIEAMHTNRCDIQERLYRAGFVLCLYEGLHSSAGRDERIYFIWDEDRHGFFESEEPDIFRHVAY